MIEVPQSTINWLLSEEIPPVKYLTLKNLLEREEAEKEVETAGANINNYFVIQEILKNKDTFWGKDAHLYRKYLGGYWQLIFLSDFNADGSHPDIKYGCEYILNDKKWYDYLKKGWIHCLAANILRSLNTLGYGHHEKVREGYNLLANKIINDNGIECPAMDYSVIPRCFMAVPKLVNAFNAAAEKNEIIIKANEILIEQLLEREVYKYLPHYNDIWKKEILGNLDNNFRENPEGAKTKAAYLRQKRERYLKKYGRGENTPKPGWLKFGFPMHYNSNILEALAVLADAGVKYDERMKSALDVLKDTADDEKRWKMQFSLNGKMWTDVEKKGKPSRWITYEALYVLKHFEGIKISG